MPEIRRNSISDQIVLVAPERRQRPNEFAAARTASDLTRSDSTRCPFCPGNEDATPPAVEELHAADSPNQWLVRVVPNLYPAVFDLDQGEPPVVEGRTPALGKHEVVIECRRHVRQFTELSHQESELAFLAYQRRFQAWKQNPQLRFGIALKNSGEQAGASMEHVHSQLIGLTEIPPIAQTELDSALRHYESRGSCVFLRFASRRKSPALTDRRPKRSLHGPVSAGQSICLRDLDSPPRSRLPLRRRRA